jgi:glutaredoxin
MKNKAIFFHAGCPICVEAEHKIVGALDPNRYQVEVVHLGEQKSRLQEAIGVGVKSVPALLLGGEVFHINFGAAIEALK